VCPGLFFFFFCLRAICRARIPKSREREREREQRAEREKPVYVGELAVEVAHDVHAAAPRGRHAHQVCGRFEQLYGAPRERCM
jgi:hypothetical protein